jgi:hypothetical protein
MNDARLWDELSGALERRPGWHLEDDGYGKPIWCFSTHNCRVVLSVEDGAFILYVADTDSDTRHAELAPVLAWLDEHEDEYADLTEMEQAMFEHLLPGEVERWKREQG